MLPIVSIIVPVYNTAKYVEECIQSCLSQTYKNIELILVNDGSTDDSGLICKKYANLPNVYYIDQDNSGVVEARSRGVEESHGEWIMFVDSDDLIYEHCVSSLVDISSGCDIVVGRFLTTLIDNTIKERREYPDSYSWEEYLYALYSHNGINAAPWAKLFRKKLIEKSPLAFRYRINRSEDFLMNLAIAINNRNDVHLCNNLVYNYRQRESSTVNTYSLTCDYCYNLCNIADFLVRDYLSYSLLMMGGLNTRLFYYRLISKDHNNIDDCNHPFLRQIARQKKMAIVIRLVNKIKKYLRLS